MNRILDMNFEFTTNTLDCISSDIAVVFTFSQKTKNDRSTYLPLSAFKQLDTTLEGQLTKAADLSQFKGKKGEVLALVPIKKVLPSRIFIVGLGDKKDFNTDVLRKVAGSIVKKIKEKVDSISLVLPTKEESEVETDLELFVISEGILLGSYEFNKYKKQEKSDHILQTIIIGQYAESKEAQSQVSRAMFFYNATKLARDLINEPPAVATPAYLAKIAQEIGKSSKNIICTVYDKAQLEKMGMEAFLGIARASDTPPKFIHLEYKPEKSLSKEKLAIVGKGITFDSGGINVKTGDSMIDMKMDMSGAAAVLGIFSVIDEIKPEIPVMGLIAATPNLISGTSLVPGDVVKAYNGKTIEILNTDAEGRVTMADSLSYAVKKGATRIIDFATLTGACMVALGNDITGLFSNDEKLSESIKIAAKFTGEQVWELPLPKDYKKLNKSEVADIANIPNTRYGGAITAALFLEEFVDKTPWAHMDIAGPAFAHKPSDLSEKGGIGFGVRMMLYFLEKFDA